MIRFALAFGVFTVSNVIVSQAFTHLQTLINAQIAGAPAAFSAAIYALGVPNAISIVFSAYLTALSIKGIKSFNPAAV
jgi:hypothetical protein